MRTLHVYVICVPCTLHALCTGSHFTMYRTIGLSEFPIGVAL